VGREVRACLESEARALHGGLIAMSRAGERFFLDGVVGQFRDLLRGAEGAELVIAAGTQIAASSVAERIHAAYRYVAYDPSMFRSAEHPPALLPLVGLPRWTNRIAWWLHDCMMRFRLAPAVDRERAALGLPPVRDLYHAILGLRPVLAAEPLLAPVARDVKEVQVVGCLHRFEEGPLPEKLQHFLDAGDPPVFVGFGSMTDPDPAASTRLVLDAVQQAGVRAVISEGWAGLARGPLPERVMAVGALPHASLFRRASVVIHHGGAGTTTTAARAGTPQILIPHVLDQFHWARRVAALGLGPPALRRRRLRPDALAAAIRATLDNEVLAERAAHFGQRLRRSLSQRLDPADVIV
jgi:UDP:flavonoid glycosyltransferase YjiC (YdhE family)